jgi:hypothetical protein
MDVMGMQRFYSTHHDVIYFLVRLEKGFHSSLDACHEENNSFLGNFLFLVSLPISHEKTLDLFLEVF